MQLFNFDEEKKKEFKAMGFKNQRLNLRVLKQVGKTTIPIDKKRNALAPGKRISKTGKTYWETRKNRSDKVGSRI